MSIYNLDEKNKYYSLYSLIRADIISGRLSAGSRLPSKRALAADLGVSVITVQQAYEQLLAEGYVRSAERSGYFVEKLEWTPEERQSAAAVPPKKEEKPQYVVDFVRGATPAGLFPFSVWAKLMRRVLSEFSEGLLLERAPCEGDKELRGEISAYLYRSRGIHADPDCIVIGAGAEYLYGVIVQVLGRDRLYAAETPGYASVLSAYGLNGAQAVALPVTPRGVSAADLLRSGADVLHISPAHQFPTGAVMPASERSAIIEWAVAGDRYVIEDDYDSEFRLFGKPLNCLYSLCPEKVIYMNTFSKTLAPSLRIGYMVLPPALLARFRQILGFTANVVPLFEQKTLAYFLRGGYFERHLSRVKNYYKNIRKQLYSILQKLNTGCNFYDTGGGSHLLAGIKGVKDADIKSCAASLGIRVKCLSDYAVPCTANSPTENFTGENPFTATEACAVINYSGVTEEELSKLRARLAESGLLKD